MKTFEYTVPDNYIEAYHIDAADKKTGIVLSIYSIVVAVIVGVICFIGKGELFIKILKNFIGPYIVMIISMLAYIVLHELVHGIAYKALTKQKLTFGLKWSCAYCGVPDIYTYRKTALIALVAPLITFTILLTPLMIYTFIIGSEYYIVTAIIFVIHISGCVGDLYMTYLLLTKFKDKGTLIRDTGPEQWVYIIK